MRKLIFLLISIVSFTTIYAQTTTSWSFEQKNNGDGTINLFFKAKIDAPWYIYNTSKIKNGPLPTSFEPNITDSFEAVGGLKDVETAKSKYDAAFKMDILYFDREASFVQTIKRKTSEPFTIEGVLIFQTCNGSECIIDEIDVTYNIPASTVEEAPSKSEHKSKATKGLL